ncbi:CubicO group peptidase (beta-lactamase class C family) [Stackebrandtia albiflava]|uniref:CubicO group peptidase (Beta-lactamase class C family) n=1 Tax=Stackebrandtia albiflava TaxID=406432 RepID=A0A562V217_9ACTN|nr:CubicO group peptidase (beta-lactamase class C family) [Stackebrandtia albiflava]
MNPPFEIHGTTTPEFAGVRAEFAAAMAEETHDAGAQLAVYHRGALVVDLAAGALRGDSLTGVFSIGKGAAHLVVALLVQDGVLALDRRVTDHWPEFAAHGKAELTLRQLLEHRAGLIGVTGGFSMDELADDRVIAERLARQRPFWRPGTGYGYHAFTIGALTGEVVRRATGRSIQEWFEARVRAPYGLDLHLGLPEDREHRFVPVRPMLPVNRQAPPPRPLETLLGVAFNANGPTATDLSEFANRRRTRALGQSSAGAVGNARGAAGMYAVALGAPGRPGLLAPETVARFARLATPGTDLVTEETDHFGLGFERPPAARYPGLGDTAFGHSGAAGSQAFADPATGIAYGYVRRRFPMPPGGGGAAENDRLVASVLDAVRAIRLPGHSQQAVQDAPEDVVEPVGGVGRVSGGEHRRQMGTVTGRHGVPQVRPPARRVLRPVVQLVTHQHRDRPVEHRESRQLPGRGRGMAGEDRHGVFQ